MKNGIGWLGRQTEGGEGTTRADRTGPEGSGDGKSSSTRETAEGARKKRWGEKGRGHGGRSIASTG